MLLNDFEDALIDVLVDYIVDRAASSVAPPGRVLLVSVREGVDCVPPLELLLLAFHLSRSARESPFHFWHSGLMWPLPPQKWQIAVLTHSAYGSLMPFAAA